MFLKFKDKVNPLKRGYEIWLEYSKGTVQPNLKQKSWFDNE